MVKLIRHLTRFSFILCPILIGIEPLVLNSCSKNENYQIARIDSNNRYINNAVTIDPFNYGKVNILFCLYNFKSHSIYKGETSFSIDYNFCPTDFAEVKSHENNITNIVITPSNFSSLENELIIKAQTKKTYTSNNFISFSSLSFPTINSNSYSNVYYVNKAQTTRPTIEGVDLTPPEFTFYITRRLNDVNENELTVSGLDFPD
jgi:hypothetical protein